MISCKWSRLTKPRDASSEHPLTKGKVSSEQLFSSWLRANSCYQNSHAALSIAIASFLLVLCFFLKCLLGIKPELSNTASVICRLNFACDEMEPANKKKFLKINLFLKSHSVCTVDTKTWAYVPRWGRSRMPLLGFVWLCIQQLLYPHNFVKDVATFQKATCTRCPQGMSNSEV